MVKPDWQFVPTAVGLPCFDFKVDKYQREKRTVIIAPLSIDKTEDDRIRIGWACSRGITCKDEDCFYSRNRIKETFA